MSILSALRRVPTIALVTICCAAPLLAQEKTTVGRGAIERGRITFRENCAACHGKHGNGDAPGTAEMKVRPTDLTTLTKRYGTFPTERVEATLAGTDQTTAHSSGMQAWRALFLADANGNERAARARMQAVTAFIASIQAK